jgi:hypothetical protein
MLGMNEKAVTAEFLSDCSTHVLVTVFVVSGASCGGCAGRRGKAVGRRVGVGVAASDGSVSCGERLREAESERVCYSYCICAWLRNVYVFLRGPAVSKNKVSQKVKEGL